MRFANLIFGLLVVVTVWPLSPGQTQRRKPTHRQTSFGPETPIEKPVPLPKVVLEKLVSENRKRLQDCLATDKKGEDYLPTYFSASVFDVNNDGRLDLIIQSGEHYCLEGAHSMPFWIFIRTDRGGAPSYKRVLSAGSQFFTVLHTSTNGYRDILAEYPARVIYGAIWKFNGVKYQPRLCTEENPDTHRKVRVRCGEVGATSEASPF